MAALLSLTVAGCAAGGSGAAPTGRAPSTSPGPAPAPSSARPSSANPVIAAVPAGQWRRIVSAGAWRPGCPVGRADLRRVEVNHFDFAGRVRRGVLVVHADIANSTARIFTRLFEARFPIRRMRPVEAYGGDNIASLRADNTAAYNCRRLSQINAPVLKSPHANGRAIDINPVENPWRDLRCDCWSPGPPTAWRRGGEGVIVKGGPVWRAFRAEGWVWQDIDVPDYMHFDTGYPSRPFQPPRRRSGT